MRTNLCLCLLLLGLPACSARAGTTYDWDGSDALQEGGSELVLPDRAPQDTQTTSPDTGSQDTNSQETSPSDTGVVDSGVDTWTPETGVPDTGVDTGVPDTGFPDTGPYFLDTGRPDTGFPDTGVADTGMGDTGVADTTPPCPSGQVRCGGACTDLLTSVPNCGICGHACPGRPHVPMLCEAGSCVFRCDPGWADCDGNVTNGCETNTVSDVSNCGACGRTCPMGFLCSSGVCTSVCTAPSVLCSGLCVNPQTDLSNCGTCGRVCTAPDHATSPRCVTGACDFICLSGWADCDGMAANGCETDLNTATNCGSCGRPCGTGQTCSGGYCACPVGQALCGGRCVNPVTDMMNCGACGRVCTTNQGCCSGVCTDLNTTAHCGACTMVCNVSAGMICSVTGPTRFCDCPSGRTMCGGVCTDLMSDARNCSRCGFICPSSTRCYRGMCQV